MRKGDPLLYLRTAVLTLRQTSLPLPLRLLMISPKNNDLERQGPLEENEPVVGDWLALNSRSSAVDQKSQLVGT